MSMRHNLSRADRFSGFSLRTPGIVRAFLLLLSLISGVGDEVTEERGVHRTLPGVYAPGDIVAQDGVLATFTNQTVSGSLAKQKVRRYPMGELAGTLMGFRPKDLSGGAGLEASLDRILGWEPGSSQRPPCRTTLTLRLDCQRILEEELRLAANRHNAVAYGMVVEPHTGRILALGQYPGYDPNHASQYSPDRWRIRAISDVHEPGMAVRFLILEAALGEGAIPKDVRIDCENGAFQLQGHWIRESKPRGVLTMDEVVAQSSIIGLAKIGILVSPERLYGCLTNFGLGHRTGIPLQAESGGILRPVGKWDKVTSSRIPLGYGFATTQLQLVMALSAIANQGIYAQPVLIDRIETDSGELVWASKPKQRRVVSKAAAAEITRMLQLVTAPGACGAKAAIAGVNVAGNPGTVLRHGAKENLRGSYYAQFVGYCPAERPAICVGVAIEEPLVREGERVTEFAAPVFARIGQRILELLGGSAGGNRAGGQRR